MARAPQDSNKPLTAFQEVLDRTIKRVLDEKIEGLFVDMLTRKFGQLNMKIGKVTIKRIAKQLRAGETNIEFDKRRSKKVDLTITKDDWKPVVDDLRKWQKELRPKLDGAYKKTADETAEKLVRIYRYRTPKQVQWIRDQRTVVEARIARRWKKPFAQFEMFLFAVEEAAAECDEAYLHDDTKDADLTFEVLHRLYARGLQIAKEIQALMTSGFADGAHARWRSLHELAVVSLFIEKYGEPVAERYLAHEAIEYCKGAEQFQVYAKALKQRRIGKRDLAAIQKDRDDALATYGKNFRHEFGWASDALSNPNPRFSDLEAAVQMEKWRPYYRKASWNVHAGPRGLNSKISLLDEHQGLDLFGASEYGFADPAQGAAISLLMIVSTLLSHETTLDRIIRGSALLKMKANLTDAFFAVQATYEGRLA